MNPTTERRAGWSVTLGTVIGVPIRIHFTFVILLLWYGLHARNVGHELWLAIVFLILLFGCVVLHELGHAAAGLSFGVRTREIMLYPIGGIARLENLPAGRAELLIALAGPLVNLGLAVVLEVVMLVAGIEPGLPGQLREGYQLLQYLLVVNLLLLLFNLVPAFPMDGGRILRAALTITTTPLRATEIAARVGQVSALLFAVGGLLLANPFLIVIALFVFIGASQEAVTFRQRAALEGKTARDAMMTRFETLAPQDSLVQVAKRLVDTHQHDFPVVDAWDRVVGVLSKPRLLRQLSELGGQTLVLDAMDRQIPVVAPGDDLQRVLGLLRSGSHSPVLVMQERQLLGMITLEKLVEFIELSRREATETNRA